MRTVNEVTLIGALGRVETQFTTSGISCTKMSLATSHSWKDRESNEWKSETDWHNLVLWRNEKVAALLAKGSKVYVRGALRTRSYEDRDGNRRYSTEVIVSEVILLSSKRSDGQPDHQPAHAEPFENGQIADDDVPF